MSAEDYRTHTYEENTLICLRCGAVTVDNQTTKHDVWHAALAATPLIEQNQQLTSRAGTLEEELQACKEQVELLKENVSTRATNQASMELSYRALLTTYKELQETDRELRSRFDLLASTVETQTLNIRRNTMDPTKRFWHFLDELEKTLTAVRRPF